MKEGARHRACGFTCWWRTRRESFHEMDGGIFVVADCCRTAGRSQCAVRWRKIGAAIAGGAESCTKTRSASGAGCRTTSRGTQGGTSRCAAQGSSTPCQSASRRNTACRAAPRQDLNAPARACRETERTATAYAYDPAQCAAIPAIDAPRRARARPCRTTQIRCRAANQRCADTTERAPAAARRAQLAAARRPRVAQTATA